MTEEHIYGAGYLPSHLALCACRYGTMLCIKSDTGVSTQLLKFGEYFESEVTIFRRLITPGMVIAEVGANIGALTIPLAQLTGEEGCVHAFEPQRIIYQILNANLALNDIRNIYTYHVGLGDEARTLHLPRLDYRVIENFGGVALGTSDGEAVPVRTLDSYELGRIDFIKIDIEGMEVEALRGAHETILAHRPILYVENDRIDISRSESLNSYILNMGYRAWWHLSPAFNENSFLNDSENVYPLGFSSNLLCIPQERSSSIELHEMTDPGETCIMVMKKMLQQKEQNG